MNKELKKLDEINICTEDLLNLFKISDFMYHMARHDIGNNLSIMRLISDILISILDKNLKKNDVSQEEYKKIINDIYIKIKRIQELSVKSIELSSIFFDTYRHENMSNHFISNLNKMIQEIKEYYTSTDIIIDKDSLKTLEIIYPSNVLFGIFSELIINATKSIGENCKIYIKWEIKGNIFCCEIHDNGPGISKQLCENFITIDNLEIQKIGKSNSGLDIINRAIYSSNGHLLFAKSKYIGGTMVYFDFPILAFYIEGKRYDFR